MKHIKTLLLGIAILLPMALGAQTVSQRDWHWTDLRNGMETAYLQDTLWGAQRYIAVVRYNPRKFGTHLYDAQRHLCGATNVLAQRAEAAAAINGSYFNMRELTPTTYISIDGKALGKTDPSEDFRLDGILVVKDWRGRKVEIERYDPNTVDHIGETSHAVLSAGPILLKDGERCQGEDKGGFCTGTHPRSVIGKDAEGFIWMIVVDGRRPEYCEGMSIGMLTTLCLELGLVDALNLDGGGSSELWTEVQGTLNHPSDNRRFDREGARKVPNIVYVK